MWVPRVFNQFADAEARECMQLGGWLPWRRTVDGLEAMQCAAADYLTPLRLWFDGGSQLVQGTAAGAFFCLAKVL